MPQETNLNVSPYFDDFDKDKNFYKVLFKPGYPIQARELTSLQSILQNQIEQFGSNIFKEGAKVIPGQLTYFSNFYAVEIEAEFSGIPVSLYLNDLVGKVIYGRSSGVRAKVKKVLTSNQSERNNITLYVDYLESSTQNLESREFFDGEVILSETTISFGNSFISANEGICQTLSTNATSTGSAFGLSNGVYFLRGTFVQVSDQILILDQYDNKASYRVGLSIDEQIISADVDESLNDNSQGFNNFSAPGADRLKIEATLSKKDINDFDNTNFVQLATVQNGVLREINNNGDLNFLGDELARRTFDESGHYYVKSFNTLLRESLDDGNGNGGIFEESQLTYGGSKPEESLGIYKISPGKAYVKGYEVGFEGPTFLDVPKPRTTKTLKSQSVNFGYAPTFNVNNLTGSPLIDFNTSTVVSLRDLKVGTSPNVAQGNEIGQARVYDFYLDEGNYTGNLADNKWNLSLYDLETYSVLTLKEPVTLTTPVYVKGKSTGATAYLKTSVTNSSTITIYQINGKFSEKETIEFGNADQDNNERFVVSIRNYDTSDVKSVFSTGSGITFSADVVQLPNLVLGNATITPAIVGISTVRVQGRKIKNKLNVGNIIRCGRAGISTFTFGRVVSFNEDKNEFEIEAVENVGTEVFGELPTQEVSVIDLSRCGSVIPNIPSSGNIAPDTTLFSILPKQNISSVSLEKSQITIRKQFTSISITDGSTGNIDCETNELFLPFDEERYTLIRSNGQIERLSADKLEFVAGAANRRIKFNNLSADDTGGILVASLRKTSIKSKAKKKKVVDSIIIDKSSNSASGTGSDTLNDGLVYGNYPYGTRVQDNEICLNYPEVRVLYGLFESNNSSNPEVPSANLGSLDGPTATTEDVIIGEVIVGETSGAQALYVEKKSSNSVGYIYQNSTNFISGEIIEFSESKVRGVISNINPGSKNIIDNYVLDYGQKLSYFDYSKLIKIENAPTPSRKLKAVFMRFFYDISDDGDITTANSYNSFNYSSDISSIDGTRLTDIIDYRPRVSDYTVVTNVKSPLEFDGRQFNNSRHSAKNVISPEEPLILDYSFYLPRIDRIYLTKDRSFVVKFGNPSENPVLPEDVSGAMNIANIYLPAYLFNTSDARVEFVSHKRYQMRDIFNLETRIKNLEYYTSLSILESATQNLFIDDGTGTGGNRFKSGFYVDNFSSLLGQDLSKGAKNSVDTRKGELRPSHYTTNINLEIANTTIPGIGNTTQLKDSKRFSTILGSSTKRVGDVLLLDYSEKSWLKQPFATRTENVTPFFVKLWEGSIQINPSVDVWVDTKRMEAKNVDLEGSFLGVAEALRAEIQTTEDGERLGVSPVIWNSWETTGVDLDRRFETSSSTSSGSSVGTRQGTLAEFNELRGRNRTEAVPNFRVEEVTSWSTTVTRTNTFVDIDLDQRRSGVQYTLNESIDTESLGDRIVRRDVVNFLRSRNLEFIARRLKPFTRVYPFFDGSAVSKYCFSKLVEIEMVSGSFQVGEDVSIILEDKAPYRVRVAKSNHKYGPYNNPTDTFDRNPYNRNETIPANYSSSSTILNIDTESLSDFATSALRANISKGATIRGLSSGAEATVTDVKLVTDRVGTLIGSFFIPGGVNEPKFETGRSRLRLTSSSTNSRIPGVVTTSAEETFYSEGQVDTYQQTTLSLRNARVDIDDTFEEDRTLSDSELLDSRTSVSSSSSSRLTGVYRDPLAQSFVVDDNTGVYVTKLDLYFRTKDESLPVTVQIREVELGIPSQRILAFSEVELSPDKVNLSEDASVATTFTFESPVYLEGQREYAIIVISNSNEYNLWISRLGESDVQTLGSESGQVLVTTQTLLGSLFKSQNASTWTPSQYEDLTFDLYRADFKSVGFTEFFNSDLDDSKNIMTTNPLTILSNRERISLSSTITSTEISIGQTVTQNLAGLSTATGYLVGFAGSAFSTLGIITSGIGYTGTNFTYNNVALRSITGTGFNATADITINNGGVVASGATIVNGGNGYVIGDVLEPISIGSSSLGSGMRFSVSQVRGNNELVIDSIQGKFTNNEPIKFINSSGITTDFTNVGVALSISNISTLSDGDHIKVFHRNHGMHSSKNIVKISNIESDIEKQNLQAVYPSESGVENTIFVSNTSVFATFENYPVGPTNKGYIKINEEILSYTGVTATTLTGVEREIDFTKGYGYKIGTKVEKYEVGGVSLRRINTDHDLSEVTIANPITIDTYYIKVDMSTNGTNRSLNTGFGKLKFNSTKNIGGTKSNASYNVQYEMIIPNITQTTPTGTSILTSLRSVTGTSLGGSEISFIDNGFEDISNAKMQYFNSPRLIASRVNEENFLPDLPGNKSANIAVKMFTSDSRISPTIDLSNISLTLVSNRINDPIQNYADDPRVNTLEQDPHLFRYITNPISLENPASSIKVILDAYIPNSSDIRVLYSIGEVSDKFVLFPGYLNIDSNGTIIDPLNSDGNPDKKPVKLDLNVGNPKISNYKEYTFSTDLPTSFDKFRIKIVGSSENQAYVPTIRNLRVIALA